MHKLPHLSLATLRSRFCCYPHSTGEKAESPGSLIVRRKQIPPQAVQCEPRTTAPCGLWKTLQTLWAPWQEDPSLATLSSLLFSQSFLLSLPQIPLGSHTFCPSATFLSHLFSAFCFMCSSSATNSSARWLALQSAGASWAWPPEAGCLSHREGCRSKGALRAWLRPLWRVEEGLLEATKGAQSISPLASITPSSRLPLITKMVQEVVCQEG